MVNVLFATKMKMEIETFTSTTFIFNSKETAIR